MCAGLALLILAHPSLYSRSLAYLVLTGFVVALGAGGLRPACSGLRVSKSTLAAGAVLGFVSTVAFVRASAGLGSLILLISPFVYLWAGILLGYQRRLGRLFLLSSVVGAGAAGAYGLLQFAGWDFLPSGTRFHGRIVSVFENPNYMANYAAAVLPMGLALFARSERNLTRLGWSLLICLSYAGLLVAGSRGAWWGAVAGALVLVGGFVLQYRSGLVRLHRVSALCLALALVVITLLIRQQPLMRGPDGPIFLSDRLASSSNIVGEGAVSDRTINHRYLIWRVTWHLIKQRPIAGHGLGLFEEMFVPMREALQRSNEFPVNGWDTYFDPQFAHNEFLHVWTERGIFGLMAFFALVGVILRGAVRALWTVGRERLDIVGLIGLVTVMLVHGLVSYPIQLPLNGILFWVSLGILSNLAYVDDESPSTESVEGQR